MHLNAFLAGNLAGLFFMRNKKKGNYDMAIILCIVLIVLSLKYNSWLNFHDGAYSIFFVPLLLLLSYNTGYITRIFSKKIFGFLGEISYCIYILQVPVFYYGRHVFSELHIHNLYIIFYASLFALLIFAIISYLFIETPLRLLINKIKISKRGVF
jgi:Predicted acyltransferases